MKSTIILSTLFTITMTSFTLNHPSQQSAVLTSEQVALHVIGALQHSSTKEYSALFPSLEEFQSMMDKNSILYGDFLPEAKQEFALNYERELVPAVRKSFERILQQGIEKGIDWSHIRYERFESDELNTQPIKASSLFIVFSSNGKAYKLTIEKALVLHGQWKVSQFIRLV